MPRCPRDGGDGNLHAVKNHSGAGGVRRVYMCSCGFVWSQERLGELKAGQLPCIQPTERAALGGTKRTGDSYRCGKCGQVKRGHICTAMAHGGDVGPSGRKAPRGPACESAARWRRELAGLSRPLTEAQCLAFLRKHDLRPSELDAELGQAVEGERVCVVRVDARARLDATRAYAANAVIDHPKRHTDMLTKEDHVPKNTIALFVSPRASAPPAEAFAILLYVPAKRGHVPLVHVRHDHRRKGYASLLASAVQNIVPEYGSLTVESPSCTALAAVRVWLRAGFMADDELLRCTLAEDAAYNGARSVRLTFAWHKNVSAADEQARISFLQKVVQRHPTLAAVCTHASTPRLHVA